MRRFCDRWPRFGHTGNASNAIVSVPDAFLYTPPFAISYADGRFNVGSFDVSSLEPTPNGKAYWADVVTGNDTTGAGTELNPWKSLNKVLLQNDYDVIYLASGTYKRGLGGAENLSVLRTCSIKKWPGHPTNPIVAGNALHGAVWVADVTYTNTYKFAHATVTDMMDVANVDSNGYWSKLTSVASAALVNTTPGSWYTDATNVWVRTIDSRPPDDNVWPMTTYSNILIRTTPARPDIQVYLENLTLVGGPNAPLYPRNHADDALVRLYAKNCHFSHSKQNGVQAEGVKLLIFQDCQCYANRRDGFNYHANGFNVLTEAIEINCIGKHNGDFNGQGIWNGSTLHDGSKIIRINGQYYENVGPNVGDIGTTTPTQTWMLGCNVHDSTSDVLAQDVGIEVYDGWLDRCVSYGNAADLKNSGGTGTVRTRNTTYTTSSGTITGY